MLYPNRCLSALLLVALLPSGLLAQTVLEFIETVSADGTVAPFVEVFEVPTAGEYEIVVSDFGVASTPVPPAAAAYALISRTDTNEVTVRPAAPGTSTAIMEATEHRLTLIVRPDSDEPRSSIGISINPQGGGSAVLDRVEAFDGGPAVENPTPLEYDFVADVAGRYEIAIIDTGFPDALAAIETIILRADDGTPLATLSDAGTVTLDLNAGEDLRIVLVATRVNETNRGLLAIDVSRGGTSAETFTARIGDWTAVIERPLQVAVAGNVALSVTDFAFPQPVAGLSALVLQNDTPAIGPVTGSGQASGTLGAGSALFLAAADDAATGTAGFNVVGPGDSDLLDEVVAFDADAGATDNFASIDAKFSLTTADTLAFTVRDFRFPAAFSAVNALIVREGSEITRLDAPGTRTVDLEAGNYSVAVLGELPQGGSGLLAVGISASDGTPLVEEFAAGGGAIRSVPVVVDKDDLLRLDLTDLEFPAPFVTLDAALTRGTELIGSAFGGGRVVFDATAGDYLLHLIARPDQTVGHSTYTVAIGEQPRPPTATLGSDTTSVPAGGSVELTWDSQFADGCVASGGWSGSKGTDGSERVSNIRNETEFRLTCTGAGGSADDAVVIAVRASSNSGGGGATGAIALMVLLLASLRCPRRSFAP